MSYQSQRIENVYNVKSGGGLLAADADRIEAVFANWWTTSARAQVGGSCSLILIVLDALDTQAGLHREYTSGWTAVGTAAGTALPGNVTSAVKLATGLRGRSFRGRIYWPALTASMIVGGQINATNATAIQASVNLLRTTLAGGTPSDRLVVVSYRANKAWRATGVATEVTSASTHLNLDSMRRRLPGRGL
jgi:hypothetical protein